MAQLKNRKDFEKFVLSYYTKNKPKGITLKKIRMQINNSLLADLKDEVALIRSISKNTRVLKKKPVKKKSSSDEFLSGLQITSPMFKL